MNRKRKWGVRLAALLFGLLTAGILFLTGMERAKAPTENSANMAKEAVEDGEKLLPGAAITQTMLFLRCGHSVSRRIEAGENEQGLTFSAMRERFPDWVIRDFSPRAVSMERELTLYCPMHQVLSAGDSGEIALSVNRYGDGMAVEKVYDITLSQLSTEKRDALIAGIGFDSREKAEAWLHDD